MQAKEILAMVVIALLLFLSLHLAGCNTARGAGSLLNGAGSLIQGVGQDITEAADGYQGQMAEDYTRRK